MTDQLTAEISSTTASPGITIWRGLVGGKQPEVMLRDNLVFLPRVYAAVRRNGVSGDPVEPSVVDRKNRCTRVGDGKRRDPLLMPSFEAEATTDGGSRMTRMRWNGAPRGHLDAWKTRRNTRQRRR
ncbi:hypothetical protein [Nonomuraea sp. NPDC049480]|uniref:hypothetical protein n=1 Tax=Nonomuraea sp. NPDC049480 TaxID=3364353 RepID=UPI0037A7A151